MSFCVVQHNNSTPSHLLLSITIPPTPFYRSTLDDSIHDNDRGAVHIPVPLCFDWWLRSPSSVAVAWEPTPLLSTTSSSNTVSRSVSPRRDGLYPCCDGVEFSG